MPTRPHQTAFPSIGFDNEVPVSCSEGLTKRELFAALAMVGYCSSCSNEPEKVIAAWAVLQADALIERLNA